ncbi:TPA: phage tail protein [Stenotrophomonas maltophilia]
MNRLSIMAGGTAKALTSMIGNNSGNAPVFLMLGSFKFSLNTAVFQEIQQSFDFRWRAQERIGQMDALQYTGPGDSRMTLPGVVYPQFKGDETQMVKLRKIAEEGKPQRLLTGMGGNLGLYVVEKLEVTHSNFTPKAQARKQEFTLTLRKYADAKKV